MAEKHEQAYQDSINGMKYKEIASKYDVSLSTVKSWKTRYDWQKSMRTKTKKVCVQNQKSTHTKLTRKSLADTDQSLLLSVEQNELLTDKQRLFCLCYIKNFNATQAVMNAEYEVESPQRASEIGYQLLQLTPVRDEIQRLKFIKAQSILITQDDIVERYMRIAFADMGDYLTWGREEQPVIGMYGPVTINDPDTGEEMPLTRETNVVRLRESTSVDTSLIHKIKQGKDGISIELISPEKAMAWLDKYFLMNPLDKHKIDYDNARLALEKQKSESGQSDARFEVTVHYGGGTADSSNSKSNQEIQGENNADHA